MNDMEKQDLERGAQPPGFVAGPTPQQELVAAMTRFRWCWSCGSTFGKCVGWAGSGVKVKCCPDCRHPDSASAGLVDPVWLAQFQRALQAVVWKAGGRIEFTEKDMVALPKHLPPVTMHWVTGPGTSDAVAWLSLPGWRR